MLKLRSLTKSHQIYTIRKTNFAYNFKDIENKWYDQINEHYTNPNLTNNDPTSSKFYCLAQFPYPSGKLHMGHARVYYISDTLAKFERMKGRSVIHPMGWDSFGLPAENAAIERNIDPAKWTKQNIQEMKKDLIKLGLHFNWERELSTCDPEYYRWTQWIFLQLYKKGLAYKKMAYVNWDPVDNTVLANEQVDDSGRSWRSGAKVIKKQLSQWFFKITDLAPELKQDLDNLKDWPDKVKEMQKGWIGYSEGANIKFAIYDANNDKPLNKFIEVYTTRIDTIYGVTFLGLSFENPLSQVLIDDQNKQHFLIKLNELQQKSEIDKKLEAGSHKSKEGIKLNGYYAKHPLTNKKIPIYICDYVLQDYGNGAIMGVPAHDERDLEFAKQHSIDIITILKEDPVTKQETLINSDEYSGLSPSDARVKIIDQMTRMNIGNQQIQFSLRDWLVSRQRYWGVPIPMIDCQNCGCVPLEEKDLPLMLPDLTGDVQSLLKYGSPLKKMNDFLECKCPKCGGKANRETDTLDTFVDSSWYFLRFLDPKNQTNIFSPKVIEEWMPVDVYVGGMEHAILHLLYSRFIHKFLYNEGYIKKHNEPFAQLITQGLVKGKTFKLKSNGKYLKPEEISDYSQEELEISYEKMSKSKGNGVSPTNLVNEYGSDCLRMSLFFYGPSEKDVLWEENMTKNMLNTLDKLHKNGQELISKLGEIDFKDKTVDNLMKSLFEVPEKRDIFLKFLRIIENLFTALDKKERNLHVGVARMMEALNFISNLKNPNNIVEFAICLRSMILYLYPLCPFLTSEIWNEMSKIKCSQLLDSKYLGYSNKPLYQQVVVNPQELINIIKDFDENIDLSIQIEGKSKGLFKIPKNLIEDDAKLINYLKQHPKFKNIMSKNEMKIVRPKVNKKLTVVNLTSLIK